MKGPRTKPSRTPLLSGPGIPPTHTIPSILYFLPLSLSLEQVIFEMTPDPCNKSERHRPAKPKDWIDPTYNQGQGHAFLVESE